LAERRSLTQVKDALVRIAFAGTPASQRDPETTAVVRALADDAAAAGRAASHEVPLSAAGRKCLFEWLGWHNGPLSLGRVTFEDTADGGILVRTVPNGGSRG